MSRLSLVVLNFILIIVGFLTIIQFPINPTAIILGMLFISVSMISFAMLIYFPPQQPKYVKLKVVTEEPRTMSKTHLRPKKKKTVKKAKRKAKR